MRSGKSDCSLIQLLKRVMSSASVCAVTSGCYKVETSVSAMHIAGFDQVPMFAQVNNLAASGPWHDVRSRPKENPAV